MIRNSMAPSQSLPSLDSLMRRALGSESAYHTHTTQGNHPLGQGSLIHSDRLSSSYQQQPQSRHGTNQLTMPIPIASAPLGHASGINDPHIYPSGITELESRSNLAIPSPISPRPDRCPSLAESIFHVESCPSPADSGPTTPVSEHGLSKHNSHGQLHKTPGIFHDNRSHIRDDASFSDHHKLHIHTPPRTMLLPSNTSPTSLTHIHQHQISTVNAESEEKVTKQEKRRRNHLNSEKRRRENIKGGMDSLVDLVPSCRNIQESKANILKKTRDYMLQLMQAYNGSQREIAKLRQENQDLRRLLALQSNPQQIPPETIFRGRQSVKDGTA